MLFGHFVCGKFRSCNIGDEGRRKVINCLVEEISSSVKVSERTWKVINWFVEVISSGKVGECGWKVVKWLIETTA